MSKRKPATREEMDVELSGASIRPCGRGWGTPQWHARDIRENGIFGDVGEIDHLMYRVECYGEQAGRKLSEQESERAREVSGLPFLGDRLRAACALKDEERTTAASVAFNVMQHVCGRALMFMANRGRPEDWGRSARDGLRALLLEIHACEGDVLRFEGIISRSRHSAGGKNKITSATTLLKAMAAALLRHLGRSVTAKELIEEGKKRGWIEERGGDLLLKGRNGQSIISNDLKLIGDRLRKSSRK